ncbi:hypothetical protein HWV62_8791 [Athelia sp. TMB]|nr:hypothetical protein HWV62_8791 [Athelia sp. TMB]
MSYPSYPYHEGGYSSMPTTPRTPYPWDLQEQDTSPYQQQPQDQQQQPPQDQHQQEPQQQMQMQPPQDAYDPPAPPHPPLQMIQLEERPPPAARRASAEHERPDGPHAHKPRIRVDTRATSPAAKGFHPYRRPADGGSGSARQAHVRFAAGQPQGSMSAPSVPGPSRTSLGSTSTSSPLARSFTPLPPSPAPAAPAHKLLIRTDIAYAAGTLTAHLELPGLARGDVRVALGTCAYNRVRQLVVSGRALPPSSADACVVRERRYGEFRRVLAVPPDTKPGDVEAEMAHGVLVLRIAVGPPAEAPEEEIAVR